MLSHMVQVSKGYRSTTWGSSGKTGTAETGIDNGRIIHGWFTGFIPSNNPQYAITVFINNGRSEVDQQLLFLGQIGEAIIKNIKR